MYDVFIPGEVAQSTLSTPCKYFYGELRGLAQRDGCVYASNAYLEKHCQISEKQIQRNLRCLEICGFIHIDTDGKHRKIYLSTATPTNMSAIPDKNVGQNKEIKDNKDYVSILSPSERAWESARACEVLQLPNIKRLYSRLLNSREAFIIALTRIVDLDKANAVLNAYYTLPAYNLAYWQVFDANKLSYVACAIKRKNVENVQQYVATAFAVPEDWKSVEHIKTIEAHLCDV